MPSSGDDSPGPPGEEHVQTERFNKKPMRKDSPSVALKDDAKGLSYSPTMETSSPEYESGKDFGKFKNQRFHSSGVKWKSIITAME